MGRKHGVGKKEPGGLAPCSICAAVIDPTPWQVLCREKAPEPAVLDNFVKSLFGPTVAVTASFKTRRTQEVTSTPLFSSCDGRKRGLYCTFQKEEGTRSFLPAQGLARGGVYDCITYGAWDQISWFRPVNSLFPPNKMSTAASGDGSVRSTAREVENEEED
jgi:hypothetical protein